MKLHDKLCKLPQVLNIFSCFSRSSYKLAAALRVGLRINLSFSLVLSLGIGALFSHTAHATAYAEQGFILTSIKPIQLIAADITQGVVKVDYLLPAGASPHAYSLRPSEVKKIQQASSIYWVGPVLESFMQKPLSKYPQKTFALANLTNAFTVESKSQKDTEQAIATDHAEHEGHQEHEEHMGHDEEETGQHQAHDQHQHPKPHVHKYQGKDPHIWLSPEIALQIAALVKAETIKLYPQHELRIEANYQQFNEQIEILDLELNTKLSSLKALGFLVFHDAYSRFIEHYQLNQVAALTINPAKRPGAKHLAEIKELITTAKPVCIFSEPQFSKVAIKSVVRNHPIQIGQLDPLATASNLSDNRYTGFMKDFGEQFIDCLGS